MAPARSPPMFEAFPVYTVAPTAAAAVRLVHRQAAAAAPVLKF